MVKANVDEVLRVLVNGFLYSGKTSNEGHEWQKIQAQH